MDSSIGKCSEVDSEEFIEDKSALLSLQPWIFKKEVLRDYEETAKPITCSYDHRRYKTIVFGSAFESEFCPRSRSKWIPKFYQSKQLRRYHPELLFTSPESCLIPQVLANLETKEYIYSAIPSSVVPALRPLLITNGDRIISKKVNDSMDAPVRQKFHKENGSINFEERNAIPLPDSREVNRKSGTGQFQSCRASTSQRSHKFSQAQDVLDGVFLFLLGVTLGVMLTVFSNRSEMEKLNHALRQTQSLVQDLQEELHMKDSLVVKELANESLGEQVDTHNHIHSYENQISTIEPFSKEEAAHDKHNFLQSHPNEENPDSLSCIAAELQAELEMLDQSIDDSLEGGMTFTSETDHDLVGKVVHGELREEMFLYQEAHSDDEVNDGSRTPTFRTENLNYAVSPRELSMHLHQVIQSQLEERVKELETALYNSQQQLQHLEASRCCKVEASRCRKDFCGSDSGSWTERPIMRESFSVAETLCLNLSGNTLDAYDEAYAEFMNIGEEEERLPSPSFDNHISTKM